MLLQAPVWPVSLILLVVLQGCSASSVEGGVDNGPGGGDSANNAPASGGDGATTDSGGDTVGNGNGDGATSAPGPTTDDDPPQPPAAQRDSANILFSGHSLLYNPIPETTSAIAAAKNVANDWEQQSIGGSPLRVRTRGEDGNSDDWSGYRTGQNREGDNLDILAELAHPTRLAAGQHYDTLVVTERHDPLDTLVWERTVGYLRDYHDRVAEHGTSRTLFWQSWPDIDKNDPTRWIDYVRDEVGVWECIAAKVNASLEAEGKPTTVVVAPGALVLARVVEEALAGNIAGLGGSARSKLDALFSDNVHPTELTAYALGAAVYAAVYGASPEGASAASGDDPAMLADLERIAWEVVHAYPAAARSRRDLGQCRNDVVPDICNAYYAIRGRDGDCDTAASTSGPLRWPDDELPLR